MPSGSSFLLGGIFVLQAMFVATIGKNPCKSAA